MYVVLHCDQQYNSQCSTQFITDKSKLKYCLALAKPTYATENIGILFDNTCNELQTISSKLTSDEQPNVSTLCSLSETFSSSKSFVVA